MQDFATIHRTCLWVCDRESLAFRKSVSFFWVCFWRTPLLSKANRSPDVQADKSAMSKGTSSCPSSKILQTPFSLEEKKVPGEIWRFFLKLGWWKRPGNLEGNVTSNSSIHGEKRWSQWSEVNYFLNQPFVLLVQLPFFSIWSEYFAAWIPKQFHHFHPHISGLLKPMISEHVLAGHVVSLHLYLLGSPPFIFWDIMLYISKLDDIR